MKPRQGTWRIRWLDEDRTVGEIIRMFDYPGLPRAPTVEGRIERSKGSDNQSKQEQKA